MNIGLVLSGGMAKGAYQIGALKALNHFIPIEEVKYISCASIGVLNGYAYMTQQLDKAHNLWSNVCYEENRLYVNQILRSSMLQQNIKEIYEEGITFNADFYCSLFDTKNRACIYKNISKIESQEVLLYLKASVSMPLYNRPVYIGNSSYFDGAMIDNIPVYPLLKHNLDYIICIYFDDICYKFENPYFDNKIIKITFPSENSLKQSLVFNNESINHMIDAGFEKTKILLDYIFKNGYQDIEYIYDCIEKKNQVKGCTLRITGDVLVTNLNKITQRLSKKLIL